MDTLVALVSSGTNIAASLMSKLDVKKISDAFFGQLDDPRSVLKLFDYMPNVSLFVKDREHRFVKVNRNFLSVTICERNRRRSENAISTFTHRPWLNSMSPKTNE